MADLTNARFETLHAREAALNAGLCADCKIRPRALNQDFKLGKRCEVCKVKTAARPQQGRYRPLDPIEASEISYETNYLDGKPFAEYCVSVLDVIRELGECSIGQQKRFMGEAFRERMHIDSLTRLSIAGLVRQTRFVAPCKWVAKDK